MSEAQDVPKKIAVSGTLRARRGATLPVLAAMAGMTQSTRAEEGCEVYSYAIDVFEPTTIRIFEIWRDEASFRKHRQSNHLKAWRAKWADLGLDNPSLIMYEVHQETPL
jgi:quinol monooxygenase YgiN